MFVIFLFNCFSLQNKENEIEKNPLSLYSVIYKENPSYEYNQNLGRWERNEDFRDQKTKTN